MNITTTTLEGVLILETDVHGDSRECGSGSQAG